MRVWSATVVVSALSLALLGAMPVLAAPGDLDPSFSGDGKVQTRSGDYAEMHTVAVGPNGTIFVGGTAGLVGGPSHMTVVRYLSDGRLDLAFSGDGKASVPFTGGARGNDIALQSDGKVVVVGAAQVDTSGSVFAVARLRANGTLDPAFSADGKVTTAFPVGWSAEATGVAVQPGGKILVVGSAVSPDGSSQQVAVARYLATGTVDRTFGVGGTVMTPPPAPRVGGLAAEDVALQSDGKIVVVGSFGGHALFLVRYLPDGRLDTTFGGGEGIKFSGGTQKEGLALALQPDGKIVVTGSDSQWNQVTNELDQWFIVGRFLSTGRPDPVFGVNGIVRAAPDGTGQDIAIAPNGTIVAAATFMSTERTVGGRFTVARLRSDGTMDNSFGGGTGFAWTTFGLGTWNDANAVVLQPNGRILAAGASWKAGPTAGSTIVVARFMAS